MIKGDPTIQRIPYLLTAVFAVLAIVVSIFGYVSFRNYQLRFRADVQNQLAAVAELKGVELQHWRKVRLEHGDVISRIEVLSSLVRRGYGEGADREARRLLQNWLSSYHHRTDFDEIRLLGLDGTRFLSVPAKRSPVPEAVQRQLPTVVKSKQVTMVDFYRDEHDRRVYLTMLIPIRSDRDTSRVLAVIALRIDPESYLFPLIRQWPTPSASAETLLVRREGDEVLFLNELKYEKNSALNLRRSLTETKLPAAMAARDTEGFMEGLDYRGVPVVAYLKVVPDSPWHLVARIDTAEIYAPMKNRLKIMIGVVTLTLALAGTALAFAWRQQRLVFYRRQAASEGEKGRLLDSMMDCFVQTKMSGEIIDFNHAFMDMLGYSAEEIRHLTYLDITPHRWATVEQAIVEGQILSRGYSDVYEKEYIRKDGTVFPVELRTFLIGDDAGKPAGMWAIVRDVTERTTMLGELRESEERYRVLVDNISVGIVVHDATSAIILSNPMASNLLGLTTGQLRGKEAVDPVWSFLRENGTPLPVDEYPVRLVLASGKPIADKVLGIRQSSNVAPVWVIYSAYPVFSEENQLQQVVVTFFDISRRKMAEAEIVRLNDELEQRVSERTDQLKAANREMQAFAYSVSHDLRAPLRSIDGFSLALLEDYAEKLDESGKEYLQRVRVATQRMSQLIDNMLKLSRITRAELAVETVDLSALARLVADELQQGNPERKVEFIVREGVIVQGDPPLLKVVLDNLIGNAWKFTGRHAVARIEFGTAEIEGKTACFVSDDGAGFDMKYAEKLFNAFQRLHTENEFPGTGIVLALVQQIIHRHGGTVWAEGTVGQGAKFWFTVGGGQR